MPRRTLSYARQLVRSRVSRCAHGDGDCNNGTLSSVSCRYHGREHPKEFVEAFAQQKFAEWTDSLSDPALFRGSSDLIVGIANKPGDAPGREGSL